MSSPASTAGMAVAAVAALLSLFTLTHAGSFTCMNQSDKPGYRCTRFVVTNLTPEPFTYQSDSLPHGDWAEQPPAAIYPMNSGAWEANSDCPLLDCFYGTSPVATYNIGGTGVTFSTENNLDKLLYGCNSESISPIPAGYEAKVGTLNYSGCYCCHPAPCDCSAFENANFIEIEAAIAKVPTITAITPTSVPSTGGLVTITGTDFVNTGNLACQFGSTVVAASFVSSTEIQCSAPAIPQPGITQVGLSVTNLGTVWSAAVQFQFVAAPAGAKLFIGSTFMDELLAGVLPMVASKLEGTKVATMTGSDTVIGITIQYTLSNIVLNSFTFGQATVSTASNGQVSFSISGLTAVASMDWAYVDVGTIIKGSGSAVDTVTLDVTVSFGLASIEQRPQLTNVQVSASITNLDIKTDPASAEILIALLKGPLKSAFQSMLQTTLLNGVSDTLNELFEAMPIQYNVGPLTIDMALPYAPAVTTSGVEVYLAAAAGLANSTAQPPVTAPRIPQPTDLSSQATFLISDYLGNTAMWALYKAGLIHVVVTNSMLPPQVPLHLTTSFFQSFLPQLYTAFPNRTFELVLNGTGAPTVTLGVLPGNGLQGVIVNVPLSCTFMIVCNGTGAAASLRGAACEPQPAFTLGFGVEVQLNATIANTVNATTHMPALKVFGRMVDLHFNLTLISTNIGQFSLDNLNMLMNMMMRAVALDLINVKLAAGFDVPDTLGSFHLANSTLEFFPGYVALTTSVAVNS